MNNPIELMTFVDEANRLLCGDDLPKDFDYDHFQQYGVLKLGSSEVSFDIQSELPEVYGLVEVGCKRVVVDLESGELTSWHYTADDDGLIPPRIFKVESDLHVSQPLSHDCAALREMGICPDAQKLVGALSLICSPFAPIGMIGAESTKHYLCEPDPELESRILQYLIPIWKYCSVSECEESGIHVELLEMHHQ